MDPAEIVHAGMAAWEQGDLQSFKSLVADDFVFTGPAPVPLGTEQVLGFIQVHHAAFPDWKFNITETQVEGNTVRVAFQISATHTGVYDVRPLGVPVPPIPPTGKHRSWPKERLTAVVEGGKVKRIDVQPGEGGGVAGTLEWLGVALPAGAA
jgi:hypothetical protein